MLNFFDSLVKSFIFFSKFLLLLHVPAWSTVLIVGQYVQQVVADEVGVVVVPGEVKNALIAKSIFTGGVAHQVRFFFGLNWNKNYFHLKNTNKKRAKFVQALAMLINQIR